MAKAKKPKKRSAPGKYTIGELDKLTPQELGGLNEGDLKKYVRAAQKSISQRKRRLEKSGIPSPALWKLDREGTPTTIDPRTGKTGDINYLRGELLRAKQLLDMPTFKIEGARAGFEEILARIPTLGEIKTALRPEYIHYIFTAAERYMASDRASRVIGLGSDIVRRAVQIAIAEAGTPRDPDALIDIIDSVIDKWEKEGYLYENSAETDWFNAELERIRTRRQNK